MTPALWRAESSSVTAGTSRRSRRSTPSTALSATAAGAYYQARRLRVLEYARRISTKLAWWKLTAALFGLKTGGNVAAPVSHTWQPGRDPFGERDE